MLGKKLDVSVYHMDILCLDRNYERLPIELATDRVSGIIKQDDWIIDGDFTRLCFEERLARSEQIILLDIPLWICIFRVIRRIWQKQERIGVRKEQRNGISLKFLYWILWRYPRSAKKKILRAMEPYKNKCTILKSSEEIRNFLKR